MSEEQEHLQHAAEHEKPGGKNHVMTYLVILFAAAFLLMLFSYLMQQRQNAENINNLSQSVSAVQSLEEIIKEKDDLEERVNGLEGQLAALEAQLADAIQTAQQAQAAQQESAAQADALNKLNQLRALYNQRKYTAAKDLLDQWEAVAPGTLEAGLDQISSSLPQEAKDIYDPLDAYYTILEHIS